MSAAQPTDVIVVENVQAAATSAPQIDAPDDRIPQTETTTTSPAASETQAAEPNVPVLAPHSGVVIYSRDGCPFCVKAKDYLNGKSVPFTGVKLDKEATEYPAQRDELISRTNHKTFPWVFVGDEFLGGYTELVRAFEMTRLHELLKGQGIEIEEDLDF